MKNVWYFKLWIRIRPLPKAKKQKSHERRIKQKNHKIIGGIKSKSYLIDDNNESKKGKGIKKCVIKAKLKFKDCKNCLEATQFLNKKYISIRIKLM